MLSGHVPFESDSDYQVMTDQVNTPPPPPTQFYPYIPAGVVNVVLKALAKDPNARFQTTEEFGAALENPDAFAGTPAVVAVAGAPRAMTAPPVSGIIVPPASGMTASGMTRPLEAPAPPPGPKPPFTWTVPRLAAIGGAVVVLGVAGAYMKMHPPFHSNADQGTPLAAITSNSGSSNSGARPQVDIPPVQVAPATPPTDSSTSSGAGNGQPATQPPANPATQPPVSPPAVSPPAATQPPPTEVPPPQPEVVIPAGTLVAVRTIQPIDSSSSRRGQRFSASLDAPLVVGGSVVVPRGADAQLEVMDAEASGHFKGRAGLQLRLVGLAVRGRFRVIHSDSFFREGSLRAKTSAAVVGGAAAVGGAIGGMFHKKKGAVEGAASGAGAGAAADGSTRSGLIILPETRIEFHLSTPVPVS
jgi:hypothetical protein